MPVGLWPLSWHLVAALVRHGAVVLQRALLAAETSAAWPLLDSLTTWFSLLATWLAARAKLENWLYWIVIDGVLVFLFYVQRPAVPGVAQCVVHRHRGRWLRRLAPAPATRRRCPHDRRETVAARAGLRRRRSAVSQELHRRRQGQSQFPGAHAPRPLRACASTKTRRRTRVSIAIASWRCTPPRPAPASRRKWSTPAPDHSCLITDYVDGRLWTPHYFTRMRDLRSLGQRLRALHAVPPPPVARFDPHGARRAAMPTSSSRSDPDEAGASSSC